MFSVLLPLLSKRKLNTRSDVESVRRESLTEISVAERFCSYNIRYLATGNPQISLSFSFRVGKSTVSGILKETCEALWHVFQPV